MTLRSGGVCSFMICAVLTVLLTASVADGNETFVVSADFNGAANYMVSNGDGTFSSQPSAQSLESASAGDIGSESYSNGIGDFDNDGDFDYIMASGTWGGQVYLFESLGPGNQFKAPVPIDQWSWVQGFYVRDMAVADFNGDGNLDFIMSLDISSSCGLYLGNGDLSFTYTPLAGTAPMLPSGADAADFDNDGDADFVVAPAAGDNDYKFYVNLNKGDGTFETLMFDSYLLSFYDGVAAADFNNDGKVDLAAAGSGYLDVYIGNGNGTFTFEPDQRYEGAEHSNSPLDNDDFNGDGNQDLVAASFGVAVYTGNGDGTFTYLDTYGAGGSAQLWSVTAAPFIPNKDPVAVVESAYPDVSVGEAIEFDGSGSSDEDGDIVSYAWEFGDGNTGAGANVQHIYYAVGVYAVTLTVTDERGAAADATTQITVVEAQPAVEIPSVQVKIKFHPDKLDLKDKGNKKRKWITAKIKLPKGYDAKNIDLSTVCIFPAAQDALVAFANIDPKHGLKAKKTKKHNKSKKELTVKFDRQAVMELIKHPSKKMAMKVQGYISHNGESLEFSGAGKLNIKMKKVKGNVK